jgi:hypothetical protein
LNTLLIDLLRQQQEAHATMIQLMTEGRMQSQKEHERIINGVEGLAKRTG